MQPEETEIAKILVVEDAVDLAQVIARELEAAGYRVYSSADGLAVLVESPSLYPNLTSRENLEVTRRLTGGKEEQIQHVLHLVRLEDAADRRVRGYSNGMRQRLGLALACLASWLIISIHTWIGLRWQSFVVASAVGIGAMVIAVFLFSSDWNQWYPWTLPGLVQYNLEEGLSFWPQLFLGSLGGVVVALACGWDVIRRDVL